MIQAEKAALVIEIIQTFGLGVAFLILAALAISLLIWRGLDTFIKKRVEVAADEELQRRAIEHKSGLDRQLEAYKATLAVSADAARLTFQRQLQEFGLYAAKRHEAYAELFKRILEAEGALAQFFGLVTEPTYEDCNREDIQEEITAFKIPGGPADRILKLWDEANYEEAASQLLEARRLAQRHHALKDFQDAKNYFLINELFLSERAAAAVQTVMEAMHDFSFHLKFPGWGTGTEGLASRKAMTAQVESVRGVMRADLQRADYSVEG